MKKVVFVTREILGPHAGGGIGTSVFGLVLALKSIHEISVLYCGDYRSGWDLEQCRSYFKDLGVKWIDLHQETCVETDRLDLKDRKTSSWLVLEKLKLESADLAVFHDYQGLGYYASLARANRTALRKTKLLTVMHGPSRWAMELNQQFAIDSGHVTEFHMEQTQVELSDWVSSPSQYIFDWAIQNGWKVDESKHSVERNIVSLNPLEHYLSNDIQDDVDRSFFKEDVASNELVFFGRTEVRKGIFEFCNALDLLGTNELKAPKKVTFLGRASTINGVDSSIYIIERSKSWPFELQFLEDYSQPEAMDYLKQNGRIVVVPSIAENAPCTVVECARLGINFLASLSGGTGELIAEQSRDTLNLPMSRRRMAEKIAEALGRKNTKPVQLSYNHSRSVQAWKERVEELLCDNQASDSSVQRELNSFPLVSVVVTHFNRPSMLFKTIEAIKEQSYKNTEIIIVDDGSSQQNRNALISAFSGIADIELVLQENQYLGAARNAGIRRAKGEYIKFQDDDNISLPNEIEKLVEAAISTNADLVTCFSQYYSGNDPSESGILGYYLPLGPATLPSFFGNEIGDANALVRKSALEDLGGFTEDYGIGFEDYELFLRFLLSQKIVTTVPEPLFWYRVQSESMLQQGASRADIRLFCQNRIARLFTGGEFRIDSHASKLLASYVVGDNFADIEARARRKDQSSASEAKRRLRHVEDFSSSSEREGAMLEAFIESGRVREAVQFATGIQSSAFLDSLSRDLIQGRTLFRSTRHVLSDNLISNSKFAGAQRSSNLTPYCEIADQWCVPHRGERLKAAIKPGSGADPEGNGIRLSFNKKAPVSAGDYLMLRTEFNCKNFEEVLGFQLAFLGRWESENSEVPWFIRGIREDGSNNDCWSVAKHKGAAGELIYDQIGGLKAFRPDEFVRTEFFLSLLRDGKNALHVGSVELKAWGLLK